MGQVLDIQEGGSVMSRLFCALVIAGLVCVPAVAVPVLSPGDPILALDLDGLVSNSSYPGGEAPPNVLDGDSGTKYLNFAGANSGFIVTPSMGGLPLGSFQLTTANDAEGRDPVSWELYGTNDAITSADNSTGLEENWMLIDSGTVALPSDRFTPGPVVSVAAGPLYTSYRMIYPELKGASLMQIADVGFYVSPDGTGPNLLSTLDSILAIHAGPDSRYPGAESPAMAIDGDINTKYLNFGELNSGLIVTPSFGPSILNGFQITTANDAVERDPTTWELYGTNDAIVDGDNSDGSGEAWTLICAGTLALPDERFAVGDMYEICNQDQAFTSYMMLFPTVKDADAANSMQIAEIQFYGVPEPATVCLLGLGSLVLLRRKRA
jgi:hypothetical protein